MRGDATRLLAVTLLSCIASAWGKVFTTAGGHVTQIEKHSGVPKWQLYPHLWSHVNVNVTCPHSQVDRMSCDLKCQLSSTALTRPLLQNFDVFVAQDESELYDKVVAGETAWCGLDRVVSGHKNRCNLQVSPFQTAYIGICPSQGKSLFTAGA